MNDSGKLRIAICQTQIKWENKETNILHAEEVIVECKAKDADMAVFPEMSFTGFSMDITKTSENEKDTISRISEIAKKHQIAVGFGWVEKVGDKAANCYTIISEIGEIKATYKKIHSFRYGGECDQFISGDEAYTIEYNGVRITPFICYDLRFPEIFRAKMADSDVFIVPANWPAKRSEHWKTLLRARAIENQAYVLGINCVGDMGGLYYSGDSTAIKPDGTIIDSVSDKEGIVYADVDIECLNIRDSFPVGEDRKDGLYIEMYKNAKGAWWND